MNNNIRSERSRLLSLFIIATLVSFVALTVVGILFIDYEEWNSYNCFIPIPKDATTTPRSAPPQCSANPFWLPLLLLCVFALNLLGIFKMLLKSKGGVYIIIGLNLLLLGSVITLAANFPTVTNNPAMLVVYVAVLISFFLNLIAVGFQLRS